MVCLGGGSGPSLIAKTFPELLDQLTAVVTVTDSGSSTGIVRSNFGIAAPGDIRATLSMMARLSGGNDAMVRLMEYRFQPQEAGQLSNMAVGNLLLTALCKITGDFKQSVDTLAAMLNVRGRVLPVSLNNTDLAARLEDGTTVVGEVNVRARNKPPIERLYLADESTRADEEVLQAIAEADVILIGPGNLYTSLLACLIFPGVGEALARAKGTRVFVANTTTAPGQTDGYSAARHLEVLTAHLPKGAVDMVILNNEVPSPSLRQAHGLNDVHFISLTDEDLERIERTEIRPVVAPLLEPEAGPRQLHKLDTMRHDPRKLRRVLEDVLDI